MLGSGSKDSIRLVHALAYEVIDQNTDVRFLSLQTKARAALD